MSWENFVRLRIYVGESDRVDGDPVFERIVREARAHAMAGATVIKGMMGYGVHSEIHTAKILRLSENLPVVVEVIDRPEKVEAFCAVLETLMGQSPMGKGMITREPIEARVFTSGS
jgi:PII-like signaling protein